MGISWNIFVIPFLGGFLFLKRFKRSKYFFRRWTGQLLIFWSAFAGLWLFVASYFILNVLLGGGIHLTFDGIHLVDDSQNNNSEANLLIESLGALLLAVVLPSLLNPLWDDSQEVNRVTNSGSNPVEKLINSSVVNKEPVIVTLSTGKTYIGMPVTAILPYEKNRCIDIVPIESGYRDEKGDYYTTSKYYKLDILKLYQEGNTKKIKNKDHHYNILKNKYLAELKEIEQGLERIRSGSEGSGKSRVKVIKFLAKAVRCNALYSIYNKIVVLRDNVYSYAGSENSVEVSAGDAPVGKVIPIHQVVSVGKFSKEVLEGIANLRDD